MEYFKGKDSLLLQEYFDLKVKLDELRIKARFRYDQKVIEETKKEIEETEKNIVIILGMFSHLQLKQIIYMSLNIDYDDLAKKGTIVPSGNC